MAGCQQLFGGQKKGGSLVRYYSGCERARGGIASGDGRCSAHPRRGHVPPIGHKGLRL